MNHRSLKVGLACAFGAFIGSIVALQLNQYWWWLGLIVGGGVGYFSYEFKKFLQAIPVAWNSVIHWHPDREKWKLTGKIFVCYGVFALSPVIFFDVLFFIPSMLDQRFSQQDVVIMAVMLPICGALFCGLLLSLLSLNEVSKDKETIHRDGKKFAAKGNPLIVYFYYVPKYTFIGIKLVVYEIPPLFVAIGHGFAKLCLFVWTVFKFIHSEERVLCAFDAAVGAGIGYAYHNALIGMLAGGIFGVLNYEIVSKRVLKLVPIYEKIK